MMRRDKELTLDDVMADYYVREASATRYIEQAVAVLMQKLMLTKAKLDGVQKEYDWFKEKHPEWKKELQEFQKKERENINKEEKSIAKDDSKKRE